MIFSDVSVILVMGFMSLFTQLFSDYYYFIFFKSEHRASSEFN